MYRIPLSATVAPVLLLLGMQAGAETMFLDGGYAEICASAAFAADGLHPPQHYDMTGSRLGLTPLEICTRAVNGYDGTSENVSESYNNRGVLQFVLGNHDAALQDFQSAIRGQASMPQAHVNLGYTLNALQRWEEAIPALTHGLELGSEEGARVYYNRGIAYEETGKLREAYGDYMKAAELDPEWEAPRQELARFQVIRR